VVCSRAFIWNTRESKKSSWNRWVVAICSEKISKCKYYGVCSWSVSDEMGGFKWWSGWMVDRV